MKAGETPKASQKTRKPIKHVQSAGGVVFRVESGTYQVLLLMHENGKWMLPKGVIEAGETPEEVALREVREEAGVSHVRIVADLGEERYFFYWRQDRTYYDKTVHYYLMEFLGGEEPAPQKEEGFVGYAWVPLEEALVRIKYRETREVIRRAQEVLGNLVISGGDTQQKSKDF
ncbi:MAG: NUDIX hydrolase [Armatimonadota bacterium]|nr:NUDIX hydrolase [Armatimonadota bacterium]MDR5702861.1 NUDIX hydrolase [Armatimonadota bacterium]